MKLIYSDYGKSHPTIKWALLGTLCGVVGNIISFLNRSERWDAPQQLVYLWSVTHGPSFAGFMLLNVVLIVSAVIGFITTSKNELHIYDSGIEGCGFKFCGFFLHDFKLDYADIISVKKHKWGLTLRTTTGRYSVLVCDPSLCVDTIAVWK